MSRPLPHTAALLGPAAALGAYATGTPLAIVGAGLLVGCILLDGVLGDGPAHSADDEGVLGRWLPRLFAPPLVVLTLLGARAFAVQPLLEQVALVLASSIYATTFGINVAHELIHSTRRWDRRLGGLMLAVLWTASFKVEHIRGHHRDVATSRDPASAPRGRSLYRHLPRALWGNLAKGWCLEAHRLQRRGQRLWRHELLGWLMVSVAFTVLAGLLAGPWGAAFVLLQGMLSRVNLEVINYVEHYGLRRKEQSTGRPERVAARHSWTSERAASRVVLLNLPRHADHHTDAARPFPMLRRREDAPVLPRGYPAMFLLALVPPLWFRAVDPLIPHPGKNHDHRA